MRAGRSSARAEWARTATYILLLCVLFFFADEPRNEESKRRLRTVSQNKSAVSPLGTVQAMDIFRAQLNTSAPFEEVHFPNVYVGERGPVEERTVEAEQQSTSLFSRSTENMKLVNPKPVMSESKNKETEGTETVKENLSLRWNFEHSWKTNLEGVNRVRGVLWTSAGSFIVDGVHFVRENRVSLITRNPDDKDEAVLGLSTTVPEEFQLPSKDNSTIGSAILRGLFGGHDGLTFGEPVVSDSSYFSETSEPEYLFHECAHPVRIELNLVLPPRSETGNNGANSRLSPSSFTGLGICANKTHKFEVLETSNLNLDVDFATKAISAMSFFSLIETMQVGRIIAFMGLFRVESRLDLVLLLGPLSLASFGWMAITDMYLCELLMSLATNVGGWGWWITASIFKGIQFLFAHIPMLMLIFYSRSRMNSEPDEVAIRGLSTCMSRAQVFWILSVFLFEFLRQNHPRAFALVWVSFWVPQIYCTATLDISLPLSMKDVTILTMLRAVWPLVSLSTRILDTLAAADRYGSHTDKRIYDPEGAVMVLAWVCLQLLVIWGQSARGPRFFIPRFLIPKPFDYLAGRETLKENEECVVCMQTIAKEDAVVTPCHHAFHKECLEPWMQMKRSCPTCRASLPHMVI